MNSNHTHRPTTDNSNPAMRLFVAVPLPEHVTQTLLQWIVPRQSAWLFRKWTHPQDYHITLQFLGDVSDNKAEAVKAALGEVKAAPFNLSLNGAGLFGMERSPRVLWAGIGGGMTELNALHAAVLGQMEPLGFAPEARPYSPHITLARKYAGGSPFEPEELRSAPTGEEWSVDRFVLMRTHMHESPMYETIAAFPLRG